MVDVKILYDDERFIPEYKTQGAAGMDLRAYLNQEVRFRQRDNIKDSFESRYIRIRPNEIMVIPTGISIEIPEGYEGQVRPRSGMALKGLTVVNSPGTIDSDYRGMVKVIVQNTSEKNIEINYGDRIAQLVIAPVIKANLIALDVKENVKLSDTDRGDGGFGSTGKK